VGRTGPPHMLGPRHEDVLGPSNEDRSFHTYEPGPEHQDRSVPCGHKQKADAEHVVGPRHKDTAVPEQGDMLLSRNIHVPSQCDEKQDLSSGNKSTSPRNQVSPIPESEAAAGGEDEAAAGNKVMAAARHEDEPGVARLKGVHLPLQAGPECVSKTDEYPSMEEPRQTEEHMRLKESRHGVEPRQRVEPRQEVEHIHGVEPRQRVEPRQEVERIHGVEPRQRGEPGQEVEHRHGVEYRQRVEPMQEVEPKRELEPRQQMEPKSQDLNISETARHDNYSAFFDAGIPVVLDNLIGKCDRHTVHQLMFAI
jgi:hypothetical protein